MHPAQSHRRTLYGLALGAFFVCTAIAGTHVTHAQTTTPSTSSTATSTSTGGTATSTPATNNSNTATSTMATSTTTGSTTATSTDTTASGSNTGTSTSSTSGTATTTSTGTSSVPVISNVSTTPTNSTVLIQWNTNIPATSQVAYGTSTSYSNYSALDSGLVTNHTIVLTQLQPGMQYHFRVLATNGATMSTSSTDHAFTTLMSTSTGTTTGAGSGASTSTSTTINTGTNTSTNAGTSTATSTVTISGSTVQDLMNLMWTLHHQLTALSQQIWQLMDYNWSTGGGTTTQSTSTGASIDQHGQTLSAGSTIDFAGRGFGKEEHVTITMGGSSIGGAFSNSAGSFTTGSMRLPSTPGTYTYAFTGQTSGKAATATITTR